MIRALKHARIELDEMIKIEPLESIAFFPPGSVGRPAMREQLSLLFVLKGSGTCRRGNERIVLKERTVYTGAANCFRQIVLEAGARGYLITINPNSLATLFENVTVAYKDLFAADLPYIRLGAESAEEMHWLIKTITQYAQTKDNNRLRIVQAYVSLFVLHLRAEIKDDLLVVSMNRRGILLKDFFSLLEDEFMRARTVDYYADKLCVSPKHLTNVIKLESGHPTSYHINQRIIIEAKRITRATGASLKQIAYELGYEDVAAFSKLFKRVTGENFSTYKCNLKFAIRFTNTNKKQHEKISKEN